MKEALERALHGRPIIEGAQLVRCPLCNAVLVRTAATADEHPWICQHCRRYVLSERDFKRARQALLRGAGAELHSLPLSSKNDFLETWRLWCTIAERVRGHAINALGTTRYNWRKRSVTATRPRKIAGKIRMGPVPLSPNFWASCATQSRAATEKAQPWYVHFARVGRRSRPRDRPTTYFWRREKETG